jgi:hypothetical protein
MIGDRCDFYITGIGLTLDDILRAELRLNTTFNDQSLSIKLSAALTTIMFVAGCVNSILSFVTFRNKDCQQVGCGSYLLASSVTSLLTITMLTIKFWFVVLTKIYVSISLSVLEGGCIFIEPILKLFLYFDGWLNACVAVERAVQVFKGVNFNRKKSKHFAQRLILILPYCISITLVHELVYRDLSVYYTGTDDINADKTLASNEYGTKTIADTKERYVSCVTRYSSSLQNYNTVILFVHLVAPFIANLLSALFIIFGAARQRSKTRTKQTFRQHVREQFRDHKQLIISPVILLILSFPRLIMSLVPGCVKTSVSLWLYLAAYFISFIPSILIFVIFVIPSQTYMKAFKQSFDCIRRYARQ